MDDVQALYRLHRLALWSGDLAEIEPLLDEICDIAMALSEADFGNVQLIDPVNADLRIAVQRGFPTWWVEFWDAHAKGAGACGSAAETRERIIVEDVEASPIFVGTPALGMQLRAGVRAVQSTPLITRAGKVVGVVSTHFRQRHRPADQALRWLDLLARQAADLIDSARVTLALRESERRFRALVMATSDAVYRLNADASRVHFLEGQSLSQLPGPGEEWLATYVDREDHPKMIEAIEQAARGDGVLDVMHRVRRPDGSVRWARSRAVPLRQADGQIAEWFGTTSDATDSMQAQLRLFDERQRLQTLLDALPVGVSFTTDRDTTHVTGNATLFGQFGGDAGDNLSASAPDPQATGRQIIYLHEGRLMLPDELPLQTAAREGRSVVPMELQVRLPGGKEFYVDVSAAPIRNAAQQIIGAVAVTMDATERKRVASLREQMRQKDEFLAVLGHELRNPLAAISGVVQLLKSGAANGDRLAMEGVIRSQVDVLQRLVDDLLDVSHISAGTLQLKTEPVSLAELLKTTAAAMRPALTARGQQIALGLPGEDVWFTGDRVRLQQIVTNLLDNACKYAGQGGGIELSGALEGADVLLRCKDSGPGIPEDMRERIFEPLIRGDAARQAAPQGLGLGLALVRRLAELHGGSASVHSEGSGTGCEFVVRIPFRAATPIERPAVVPLDVPVPAKPISVAIVEDDADVAQILSLAMERAGHRVMRFPDGPCALADIGPAAPEVIVIDTGLPGMTGQEVLSKLREDPRLHGSVFIGISGGAQPGAQGGAARFDHFLMKPIDLKALLGLLAEHRTHVERKRTLLVDDHPALVTATAELLRSEGFEVVAVSTAQAALETAEKVKPDLLLCDLALPDMDGLTLIEKLRDKLTQWGTYVAVASARSETELRAYARTASQLGVDQFIPKPITVAWLRSVAMRLSGQDGSGEHSDASSPSPSGPSH